LRDVRRARIADLADRRLPPRRAHRRPDRDVPQRPAHDPLLHGRPARAQRPLRALGGTAGRPAADRASVLREHALPHRPRTRPGDRVRPGAGEAALATYHFEDPAAEFVLAVERVFGEHPRVLDGSRAVLVGDVKLQLEAGERELWLIETHGPLEHRVAMVQVRDDVEDALPRPQDNLAEPLSL